jgi:hypothetical protein
VTRPSDWSRSAAAITNGPYRGWLAAFLALIVLDAVLAAATPLIFMAIIDDGARRAGYVREERVLRAAGARSHRCDRPQRSRAVRGAWYELPARALCGSRRRRDRERSEDSEARYEAAGASVVR